MSATIEIRVVEIQELIAGNELSAATKRLMDFVTDFGTERKARIEALNLRRQYNELNTEVRQFGATDDTRRQTSRLCATILGFLEDVKDRFNETGLEFSNVPGRPVSQILPRPNLNDPSIVEHKVKQVYEQYNRRRQYSDFVVQASALSKVYGRGQFGFKLELPEFEVKFGEITSLVGENGNGKTSLLRILANDLEPTTGTVRYPFLENKGKQPSNYIIKQNIAYIPQELPKWTGKLIDNLHFAAAIHGVRGRQNVEEVDFIINRLGLERYREARWSEISGGFKMRFAVAKALLEGPRLILLDEPLANLDINTQLFFMEDLRYLASSLGAPKAIVLTSQHLHRVETITDNIVFLKDGKPLYNGPLSAFAANRKENVFEFGCALPIEALTSMFEHIEYEHLEKLGNNFVVRTPRNIGIKAFLNVFLKEDVPLTYFRDISRSTRKLFELEH